MASHASFAPVQFKAHSLYQLFISSLWQQHVFSIHSTPYHVWSSLHFYLFIDSNTLTLHRHQHWSEINYIMWHTSQILNMPDTKISIYWFWNLLSYPIFCDQPFVIYFGFIFSLCDKYVQNWPSRKEFLFSKSYFWLNSLTYLKILIQHSQFY